jgi:hypothetical protein
MTWPGIWWDINYIIDEPCHPDKFDISASEMRLFYETVKEVDTRIQVMVNFGLLTCAQGLGATGQVADIATFTVTPWKLRRNPNYISEQSQLAALLKQTFPDMMIVTFISCYEYPAHGEPLPSANWVRETGLEVAGYEAIDGLLYYSWLPSSYMGDTIEDVADDPAYISAFSDVFAAVRE